MQKNDLSKLMTFGFEQTFTIEQWWTDEGFTATSDTPLKREKMLALAQAISDTIGGSFKESLDIWDHMQYETFHKDGTPSFVVTMDPGSIEVKTPPCLLKDLDEMARPLFIAADKAGVVAYRNWWYGIKGATEGGCHVNMGGMDDETNPLKLRPDLAVKYCAYVHNRPWIHYPFMGPDTGPEGNAMRMDEKKDFDKVVAAFDKYIELNKKNKLTADEIHALFKDTNLIAEKASYPSLFKLKNPLYLIEDRAQEALRSYEEFYLVSNMRLKIFESFFDDKNPEKLESFSDLHGVCLTSFWLWKNFKAWSDDLGLDTAQYKRFFDRQFPILSSGVNVPQNVSVKEGRRPRVIKDITKRGDTIVSKTIDTSYKRIEIFCSSEYDIDIQAQGIEFISAPIAVEDQNLIYRYLDIKTQDNAPVVEVNLLKNDEVQERGKFNLKDMMWV